MLHPGKTAVKVWLQRDQIRVEVVFLIIPVGEGGQKRLGLLRALVIARHCPERRHTHADHARRVQPGRQLQREVTVARLSARKQPDLDAGHASPMLLRMAAKVSSEI